MTKKRKRRLRRPAGPRRHIRKSLVVCVLVLVLVIVGIVKVPGMVNNSKLRTLGYSEETVKKINAEKLTSVILKNNYYSDYLAQCIDNGTIRKDYLFLYALVGDERELTDDDFLLYNRLLDFGYEQDQLENLFKNLKFFELTPLLIFDYQWDETEYIADCKKNRDHNSADAFSLDGDYLTEFKNVTTTTEVSDTLLVNNRYRVDASYAPTDLVDISTEYAADGQSLRKEAATAFLLLAKAALRNDTPFFASNTYVSYENQSAYYKSISSQVGSSLADVYTERPGFSEHQTGLAVNISATYESNANITDTGVYKFLVENANKYGFILRYPSAKAAITDKEDEPVHLLYLGKDLAAKVTASKLTYDEYYLLYLNDWYDAKDLPSADILQSTSCIDTVETHEKTDEATLSPTAN